MFSLNSSTHNYFIMIFLFQLNQKNKAMPKSVIVLCFLIALSGNCYSQQITGKELLEKSINYHDPQGKWTSLRAQMTLEQTRPDGNGRKSELTINNDEGYFQLVDSTDGHEIVKTTIYDSCIVTLDGSQDFSEEMVEKYRLSDDRVRRMRNYYVYLYGLPMKLTDPGTNIGDEVATVEFNGKEYLELKVTYDEGVGSDDWFFYMNPETFAMEGYKFNHQNGKGEYIYLEGLTTIEGVKIPKLRKWYVIQDDRFLGADDLIKSSPLE